VVILASEEMDHEDQMVFLTVKGVLHLQGCLVKFMALLIQMISNKDPEMLDMWRIVE
jgi:hypothetical protein